MYYSVIQEKRMMKWYDSCELGIFYVDVMVLIIKKKMLQISKWCINLAGFFVV